MAYGIQTTNGSLSTLTNTLISGRIFVDIIYKETETSGTVTNYTYTAIPGANCLRIHQIGGGTHTWATSTNGSGQAVITLTATSNPSTLTVPFTMLIVFSTRTSETGYGVLTTNADGDTVVSAVYPVPEFLGTITPSSTPTSSNATGEGSFYKYTHTASSSIGSGRERLVLWLLPQTNEDVWYNCQAHVSSIETGTFTLTISVTCNNTTPYYIPVGYVFAITGLEASTDTYGMRVCDSSGEVTFDSGRNHLVLKAIENIVNYPTTTGTINSYTLTSLSGVNFPAGSFPQFRQEVKSGSGAITYAGAVRVRANQVETRLIRANTYGGSYAPATYNYGANTNLTQAIINTADYETRTFALTGRTYQFGGTAYCYYNSSASQTYCTSESYHTARYRGGYGNAITYTWSLPSNPGGLSISGSNTGVDVKLVKTNGTGSVSPGTTYSCTLRCAIYDGVNTVNIDRTVTHTHESFSSGGYGDSGGGDSGGDAGDGGGGGCVMGTAMTKTGDWKPMDLARLVIWCERTLHGKFFGEMFRRGYQVLGSVIGVPALKAGGARKRYFKWTFDQATNVLRKKPSTTLGKLNSVFWLSACTVTGLFYTKEQAEQKWKR